MILQDFFTWYASQNEAWRERPWLVLGKGPSFAKVKEFDTTQFNIFGLNHVVLEKKVEIAHAIDLDVIEHCEKALATNANYLLMPWFPHVRHRPGKLCLAELVLLKPVLAFFAEKGRLLWYNKVGSKINGVSPSIFIHHFSAEAPYALLGMVGVKNIRSLGIDGGATYASNFKSLPTLLSNRQSSFDKQFLGIARSIMTYQINASPLDIESPVRIYVATTEEQMLSVKVLEYSIRKHASMTVEFTPLHTSDVVIPMPQDSINWPRTPFSFQRFIIPQVAGYSGRAIYLDSDMQVFSDIRELWKCEMHNNQLLSVASDQQSGRNPQYSVMLMDCAKLDWEIADIVNSLNASEFTYEGLMNNMVIAPTQQADIPFEWNSLEQYIPGKTKLVHYTDMNTQPWIYAGHPLGYVWVRDLLAAIQDGFIESEYVFEHIQRGWIRPSLAYQLENKLEDAFLLPRHILDLDKGFSPPYHKIKRHSRTPWIYGKAYLNAAARHFFQKSAFSIYLRRIKRRYIA